MPQRIQRQRTKGWRMPEGAVYVGRPSAFGNPAIIQLDRSVRNTVNPWHVWCGDVGPGLAWCVTETEARDVATRFFREWVATEDGTFTARVHPGDRVVAYAGLHTALHARLPELAGADLACWCPLDEPCRADVLLELANGAVPV